MKLNELFEARDTHVTFVFGRMNPPTIGHKQLLDTAKSVGGEYKIFLSQTQDSKKNPLNYSTKIKFVTMMFPEHADNVVDDAGLNTVVKVADYLYNMGYKNATFVAGSDRLDAMKQLLTQYNGVEGKAHGFYKFDVLDFKSSGEREDGAEGVAGVSASNARAAAANDDLDEFNNATGAGQHAEALFAAVRAGMGIQEGVRLSELQIYELKVRPGATNDEVYKGWNLRYQIRPREGSREYQGRAQHPTSRQTKPIELSADSQEAVVQQLKDAIDSSKGSNKIPETGNVTIFFNSTLASDVIGHGDEIFADILVSNDKPMLLLSTEDQGGMYRATDRSPNLQKDREGHIGMQAFAMPAKEAIKNGLTLARYGLGKADTEYMPGITAIPLEFRSEVYPGEVVRMNEPGLTVSPPRKGQSIGEGVAEGKFRKIDAEEKVIPNNKLNDLKSKYLPDWEMLDHRILQAKYVAKDHRHAEEFISFINRVSEEMDHFAEVTQDVAEVTVKTTTFDVKGLTILDFRLALKIDKFAERDEIEQVRMQGNFGMHESSYGRYYCSTDKKWKQRKGPKQTRAS